MAYSVDGKQVTVVGAARSGVAAALLLVERGARVTLTDVREIAQTGVDFISVGALTHSAKAFDVSLRWVC